MVVLEAKVAEIPRANSSETFYLNALTFVHQEILWPFHDNEIREQIVPPEKFALRVAFSQKTTSLRNLDRDFFLALLHYYISM